MNRNKHVKKNNKQLFKFIGTQITPVDISNEPDYIELKMKRDILHVQLEAAVKELQFHKEQNEGLMEDFNKLKEEFDILVEKGALDYYKSKLL